MTHNADNDAPIASHYCGQTQPHGDHVWQTPQAYGVTTFISTYQCAGLSAGLSVGASDERDPIRCPRCREVCKYDGWGHVHKGGLGIGSCATAPEVGIP